MRRRDWFDVRAAVMLGALALAGCGGPAAQEFGKEDVAAIRKMAEAFVTVFNAKDSAKAAGFFTESGVLMVPNSSVVRGPDSIKRYYDMRFAQGATDMHLDPTAINGHGPLAYVAGTYSLRNAPAGGLETHDRGKFVWVVQSVPGNDWRFEIVIWSSDLPPAAMKGSAENGEAARTPSPF